MELRHVGDIVLLAFAVRLFVAIDKIFFTHHKQEF